MTSQLPLDVSHLDVTLGASEILHDINLSVTGGETVALLGANGSGKSTLVRAALGIVPATAGTIRLYGQDISQSRSVNWDRIGYVPQRVSAASGVPATALEVVRSGLLGPKRLWADRGRKARQAAMEALEAVDLADRANDHVQVFSGGQAQRVLIARALVRKPDLLLLDEPLRRHRPRFPRNPRLHPRSAPRTGRHHHHGSTRDGRVGGFGTARHCVA